MFEYIFLIYAICVTIMWIATMRKYVSQTQVSINIAALILGLETVLRPVDPSHGIGHAFKVMNHSINAIASAIGLGYDLTHEQTLTIILASLLHDADDRKFFPASSQNARKLLDTHFPSQKDAVMNCIKLVSVSGNGNQIDHNVPWWCYIPRYADRIEGINIDRCIEYSKLQNRPFSTPTTIRANNRHELYETATPERFQQYQIIKNSVSVMDHVYDKLLHLAITTGIPYIDIEMQHRHKWLEFYALEFGRTGEPPEMLALDE